MENKKPTMRYILYCRKSTDTEDRQVLSLESQENELMEIARKHGLSVVEVLRESKSAKSQGRPIFASLLAKIQAGQVDGILCWKLDRLARNMVDAGFIIDSLQRGLLKEIRTHDAIHYPHDNVLLMAVQLGMANQYVRDLSDNVKRGYRAKLERGEWPNHAPFGYTNDKATKTLRVNPETGPSVIRTFEIYSTGRYTLSQVADQLNKEGFRSSCKKLFRKSLVERILKNPFYFGMMLRDGKYYAGKHQTLITKELFDLCQQVISGKIHPRSNTLLFPMRGILKCADCGCQYTASLKKGHQYYYCTNGKGQCFAHKKYLRSEHIDKLVADSLDSIRFDDELVEIMYQAASERSQGNSSTLEARRMRLDERLVALRAQELKAFDAYSDGLVSKEIYEQKTVQIKNEILTLQQEIKTLKPTDPHITLELTKNLFLRSNKARNQFLNATDEQKKIIANEVLWNLSIKDGSVAQIKYKTPYELLANAPKTGDLTTMLRG